MPTRTVIRNAVAVELNGGWQKLGQIFDHRAARSDREAEITSQ